MPLLSMLLAPHMIRTAQQHGTVPRIVVVTSEVHHWATIEKHVLDSPNILVTLGSAEYCTTKHASPHFVAGLIIILFSSQSDGIALLPHKMFVSLKVRVESN